MFSTWLGSPDKNKSIKLLYSEVVCLDHDYKVCVASVAPKGLLDYCKVYSFPSFVYRLITMLYDVFLMMSLFWF